MAVFRDHGGECCGMTHIHNFGNHQALDQWVVDRALEDHPKEHLFEVVLTDQQVSDNPVLVKGLKDRGFKLVSRFRNANSGNYCNVLHRYPLSGKGSGLKNSPYLNKRGK